MKSICNPPVWASRSSGRAAMVMVCTGAVLPLSVINKSFHICKNPGFSRNYPHTFAVIFCVIFTQVQETGDDL